MKSCTQSVAAMVAALLLFPALGRSEWLCWTSDKGQRIECASPDGTLQHQVISSVGKPMGMAVDTAGETLYWAERSSERIMAMPLSGVAQATSLVQLPINAGMRGMAVAPSIGKIYWVAENLQSIQRANLDGSAVETLPIPSLSSFDVEVDEPAGFLYWTKGKDIWRGNLDGTSRVAIVGDADQPYYLALDLQAGKLYWTDFALQEIGRANLDGTGRESLVTGLSDRPVGITLDSNAGKIYWTLERGEVLRANLDGTNIETVLTGVEAPWDIALLASIPVPPVVPTASFWGLVILGLSLLSAGTIVSLRRRHIVTRT